MGLGAIVVVGSELENISSGATQESSQEFSADPLSCIPILGRSMLERTVEKLDRAGVDVISVLVPLELSHALQPFSKRFENIHIQVAHDVRAALLQKFGDYSGSGIEHTFVVAADLYTETDLLDMYYFHREARQATTRAFDSVAPLELWVVQCEKAQQYSLDRLLGRTRITGVSYVTRDYVSRMSHPRDVRRFVSDVLRGRCPIRPSGIEAKPGIWIGEGAEVHRRARIVAPAYIGPGSKIMEDTLITRCSSIESGCCIDYGTVIEDSSILDRTQVGIWLDVCHAVANGNKLFNLERNVILEIPDPSIMRSMSAVRQETKSALETALETRSLAAGLRAKEQKTPTPETWQFGANPIQG